jgi:hypothetical protein
MYAHAQQPSSHYRATTVFADVVFRLRDSAERGSGGPACHTTAELRALGAVLQDLEPGADLPGVLTLMLAVQCMERHAAALAASLQERHQQQQQHQRTGTDAGAAI